MTDYLKKKKIGFYFTVIAAVLALIGLINYNTANNKVQSVTVMVVVVLLLELAMIVLSAVIGNQPFLNLVTLVCTILMATALIKSLTTQVDALGYAVAGLYTMDQVIQFIRFAGFAAASFLVFLISSFMDLGKTK